jgi:hypothetical protein
MHFLSQTNKNKTDMENKRTTIMVGTFEVHDGIIVVGDPCYADVKDFLKIQSKNGKYNAYVVISDEGDWGIRVAELIAIHEDDDYGIRLWEIYDDGVGVDSGTMGIFDNEYHYDHHYNNKLDEDWYDEVICEELIDYKYLIDGNACVLSHSGYGDGYYDVEVVFDSESNDNTTICGVKVIFIEEDYEE